MVAQARPIGSEMRREFYTPKQFAQEVAHCHANAIYQEIKEGKLDVIKRQLRGEGKRPRLLIPAAAAAKWLGRMSGSDERPVTMNEVADSVSAAGDAMLQVRGKKRRSLIKNVKHFS